MSRIVTILPLLFVCSLCLPFGLFAADRPLTNIAEIVAHDVPFEKMQSFRLKGLVCASLGFRHFILKDDTGTIHCISDDAPVPKTGDHVVIGGIFYRNVYQLSQLLSVRSLKVIGHTEPPAPAPATFDEILSGRLENQLIATEGQVVDAMRDATDSRWSNLVVAQGDKTIFVSVPDADGKPFAPDSLLYAKVRITGVVLTGHCGPRRFVGIHLETQGPNALEPLTSSSQDVFDAPPIDPLVGQTPQDVQKLGLRTMDGIVIAVWGDNHVMFRSSTQELWYFAFQATLRPGQPLPGYGEHILVAGRPTTDLLNLKFTKAIWKPLPKDGSCIPEKIQNLGDVLTRSHPHRAGVGEHGETLVATGTVILPPSASDPNRAVLECDGFRITYDISSVPELSGRLQQGARVKAVGCAVFEVDNWHPDAQLPDFRGFSLIARTADDLTVLARPPWWTPARLASVILGLVALLVAIFVWNRMLNRLAERRGRQLHREGLARTSAELKTKERTRLAVELHDSLSQTLTGIAWHIDTANRTREKAPDQTERHLVFARQALESCRTDLRNCIWDLRNQTLEDADAATAVRRTVQPHVGNAEVTVDFGIPRRKMSDSAFHEILCVLRELATNAVRHGKARHLAITGTLSGDALSITVADDGCGFDPERRPGSAEGHFGLLGVSERLDRINAALTVDSSPGRGATFTFTMRTDT